MLMILIVAFGVAAVLTLLVLRWVRMYGELAGDNDFSGPQKFHANIVPRIGGVAIFGGFLVGLITLAWIQPGSRPVALGIAVSALPAVAAGLLEDFTKRVSPAKRLLATAFAALMGCTLLGGVVSRTDIPGLDALAAWPPMAMALAIFVVAGVANSVNIIDGMNGLASMCSAIMLTGLAYVAIQSGDVLIAALAISVIGAILGFFLWNYPNGLIFLGDGGAYFLGFVIAELSILLLVRNPEVSPMFPLVLCAYPVWETVFSMYRRKIVRGRPMGMPDGIHLHSLIYRRLMRWAIGSKDAAILTRRNSMTAPYLWVLCSLSVVPAALWWDDTVALRWCLLLFATGYVLLYWSIVRFRTPRWLVLRGRDNTDQAETHGGTK